MTREKEKAKENTKGPEEHSLAMNKCKIPNVGQKKTLPWSEGKKGKKGVSKCNDGLQNGGFRPHQPDKGAGKDYPRTKERGKDQQGKDKEGIHPQSRLSASETPNAELYGHAWELDDWSASHWS